MTKAFQLSLRGLAYRSGLLTCIFGLLVEGFLPVGWSVGWLRSVEADVLHGGLNTRSLEQHQRNSTETVRSSGTRKTHKVGVGHGWPAAPPVTHAWMPGQQKATPLLPAYSLGNDQPKAVATKQPTAERPAPPVQNQALSDAPQSLDIDSRMPFGGVEPFGQENTAADLTSASVGESNMMVDQLEVAQGAEEKRAVFRALTHLRGAEIAAYDGIAKGHMANVDNYNSGKSWREAHPVPYLAEEEDNYGNWAFKGPGTQGAPAPAPMAAPITSPVAALLERAA